MSHPVTAGPLPPAPSALQAQHHKNPKPNPKTKPVPQTIPNHPTLSAWDAEDAGGAFQGRALDPGDSMIHSMGAGKVLSPHKVPLEVPRSCSGPTGSNVLFLWIPGKSDIFVLEREPWKVI